MVVRWRGHGYLAFMIPIAVWGLISIVSRPDNLVAIRVGLAISAIAVCTIGIRLNAGKTDEHGDTVHQALGFPMQWSGLALCLFGFMLTL